MKKYKISVMYDTDPTQWDVEHIKRGFWSVIVTEFSGKGIDDIGQFWVHSFTFNFRELSFTKQHFAKYSEEHTPNELFTQIYNVYYHTYRSLVDASGVYINRDSGFKYYNGCWVIPQQLFDNKKTNNILYFANNCGKCNIMIKDVK